MKLKVLFFGLARDVTGMAEEQIEVQHGPELGELAQGYEARFPRLAEMSSSLLLAVNEEFRERSWPLADGDEVAFIPPVSGGKGGGRGADDENARSALECGGLTPPWNGVGEEHEGGVKPPHSKAPSARASADFCRLTRESIPTAQLADQLKASEDGAVVVFEGIVRNHLAGRPTLYLEYEAYESMAVKKMSEIGREARAKFQIDRIGIVHRLGRIEVGETSVAIVVTAEHRGAAFDACRFLIDRLKQVVPIWKKEFFQDGFIWAEGEKHAEISK